MRIARTHCHPIVKRFYTALPPPRGVICCARAIQTGVNRQLLVDIVKRLPQGTVSRAWGWLARRRRPHLFVEALKRFFVRATGIDMSEAGADIIDIGGESTGPGSKDVSEQEEMGRVIPGMKGCLRISEIGSRTSEIECRRRPRLRRGRRSTK